MRHNVREFVKICRDHLPIWGPIYEFGSYQCEGQEDIADLRPLFPGKKYVGTDMREGPGVDKVMDLLELPLEAGSVGTALCLDTLEHVRDPFKAMSEIRRVLKPGGVVIVSSHMNWPVHEHPHDYWRFTRRGLIELIYPNDGAGRVACASESAGDWNNPHTVVCVLGDREVMDESGIYYRLYVWARSQDPTRIQRARRSLLPPAALDLYKRTRRIARRALGRDGR